MPGGSVVTLQAQTGCVSARLSPAGRFRRGGLRAALLAGTMLAPLLATPAKAQDSTWLSSPGSNALTTGSNWTAGVPDVTGTASFGISNTTSLQVGTSFNVGQIVFDAAASAYTLASSGSFRVNGDVVNNSAVAQNFLNNGTMEFAGGALSSNILITNTGTSVYFSGSASAGEAQIDNSSLLVFTGTATAANATLNNLLGGSIEFAGLGPGGSGRVSAGAISGAGALLLNANELTVGGNNASTTYSGVISGSGGSLVKTGTGTLTLSGDNLFDGGFTLNGGTVSAGHDNALGTGNLTVKSGTLDIQNGITIGNQATLEANFNLNVAAGSVPTDKAVFAGDILEAGGPFGVVKTGAGALELSGANNYSGATDIREGRLIASAYASIPNASDVVIASGATFEVNSNGGGLVALVGSVSGVGNIEIASGDMLATGYNGGTHTLSGRISGAGSFSLREAGTLILTGTGSSIGGDLEICACASGQLIIRGGSFSASGLLDMSGGNLTVDGAGGALSVAGIIGQTSTLVTLTVSGGATLTSADTVFDAVSGGPDPASIAVTVTGAGSKWTINDTFGLWLNAIGGDAPVSVSAAAGGTIEAVRIQIGGNATLNLGLGAGAGTIDVPFITNNGGIVADFTDSATLGASISGSGTLTKQGSGTLTLIGANTYTGTTFLNGGILSVEDDVNLGDLTSTLALDGGMLRVTGTSFTQSARPITFGANGGGFDIADAANTFTVSQSFSGSGGLSKAGAGTLLLTGSHSYSGQTTVSDGILRAGSAGAFSSNSAFAVAAGATLDLGGFDQTIGSLAGSGSVALGSSRLGVGASNASTSFSGILSGTGSLVKQGSGTLTLTGQNTYTGGTTIDGGTLIGNSASLQGAIVNNAALVFDQTTNGTFAGAISGSGALAKQGEGTLVLTGTSTLSGATTVTAGLLTVNGSLANSAVTLNGGTIGGSGTIGGLAVSGGTVAPGNSIGTLNVIGAVGFGAGTTYRVELDATGASDRISATGTATLNGGQVQVLAATGAYAESTRYSILTAQGGVSGQFAGATSDLAFLTPVLSYGGNEVVLTMARNQVAFPAVAITRNQAGASYAAEALGTGNAIYERLLGATADQARAGFDALSGEAHAQAVSVAVEDSHLVRESILNRLRAPFGSPVAGGSIQGSFTADLPGRKSATVMPAPVFDPSRFTIWGEAIGAKGSTDRDGNAGSLHRSGGGMLLGMEMKSDTIGAAQWRLGVAGGYTQTDFDIDARSAKGELSSAHGAIYGGTRLGAISFRAGAAYAWSETDMRRQVSLPGFTDNLRLDGRSATAQAFAEIGYGVTLGPVALEPFAQIAAVTIRTDRAAEQGGPAALVVLGRDQRLGFTTLGLRAEAQLGALPLIARGMLGWRHAFGDTTPAADLAFVTGVTPFRSYAAPLARDTLLAEAGLAWKASSSTTLGLSYGAALSNSTRDHALKGRIDIAF